MIDKPDQAERLLARIDEGGIMCRLEFSPATEAAAFTSLTHLRFDPRLPLARDIAAYQKHRVKRLRRHTA